MLSAPVAVLARVSAVPAGGGRGSPSETGGRRGWADAERTGGCPGEVQRGPGGVGQGYPVEDERTADLGGLKADLALGGYAFTEPEEGSDGDRLRVQCGTAPVGEASALEED